MNSNLITLKNPSDDSMGASIRSLLTCLRDFSASESKRIIIDLSNVNFVHPFLILPLCALISKTKSIGKSIKVNNNSPIKSYLNTVCFPSGFDAEKHANWKELLQVYASKTYMPACKIPAKAKNTSIRENVLTTFESILIRQLNLKGQLVSVVKYLISEAIDNIVDHSHSSHGWMMVQNYPSKGYIDICIADTGLGILGSYKNAGFETIKNHAKALDNAINGKSTKPETNTRGYGLDTSRKMLVNGINGKYFLFSGDAFYIYTIEIEQIIQLDTDNFWDGTMLALQIPANVPAGFNYTTYLE